jgi:hypothetical protein
MLRTGNGVVVSPAGWTALGMGGGPAGSMAASSSTSCRQRLALGLRGRDALKETARPPVPAPGEGDAIGVLWSAGGSGMRDGLGVLMVVSDDEDDGVDGGRPKRAEGLKRAERTACALEEETKPSRRRSGSGRRQLLRRQGGERVRWLCRAVVGLLRLRSSLQYRVSSLSDASVA